MVVFVFRLWSKIKPARCKLSDLDPILYFRTQNEIEPISNCNGLIIAQLVAGTRCAAPGSARVIGATMLSPWTSAITAGAIALLATLALVSGVTAEAEGFDGGPPVTTVTVDPKNVTHKVNELFNGCHSDSGYTHQPRGLYAQMVLDESFEGFDASIWQTENYTVYAGAFAANHDLVTKNATWHDAVAYCNATAPCFGFTFKADVQQPTSPVKVYFKQRLNGTSPSYDSDPAWVLWVKGDFPPNERPPPPPMNPWRPLTTAGSLVMNQNQPFHGRASLHIKHPGGGTAETVGMSNRGLGHEGLVFEGGKPYEGYFFAKAKAKVTFSVAIVDYTADGNKTLATQDIHFAGGGGDNAAWSKLNFTLTPSASTTCVGLSLSTDEVSCGTLNGPSFATAKIRSHICVQCGGEFTIGLSAAGEASIDYIYLQPGSWGVVPGSNPLGGGPGLASAGAILTTMGIKVIRQGGSFADGSYYFWKDWRGPPWERPSLGAVWGSLGTLISGWGPFEMMDMCDALGIEPVFTTNAVGPETAQDMADLVEYLYGDASTTWGKMRIADGRVKPYETKFFE